jgi:type IV secretory pathway VirB10-like protein
MLLGVPRMPWSDDVLRGLRWGAILVAGLAIGVACYRVVHESPPNAALETSALASVSPAATQENSDSLPSAKSIDKPAGKRALSTSGSRPVPAPPARAARPVVSNPPRVAPGDPALTGEPASKNEDDSVTDEKPAGPSAEMADEKDADHGAAEKTDSEESSGPASTNENVPKQEARGKRWIKAVGRWLGIGRKDQPH